VTEPRGRPRILFLTEGTSLAHLARPFALAKTLDPARYDAHFATAPGADAERVLAGSGVQRWTLDAGAGPPPLARRLAPANELWSAEGLARGVEVDRALFADVRPDLVVADLRPSLSISARLAGVPSAMITNAFWTEDLAGGWRQPVPESPLARPYLPGLTQAGFELLSPVIRRLATGGLNAVRRRYGLRAFSDRYSALYEADHLLLVDHPALFRLRRRVRTHHFVGPALWAPGGSLPDWWDGLDPARPIVYVGMGTTGKVRLIPTILEALAALPVQAVVATGGRPVPEGTPSGTFVAPYLPGDVVARRAAVVIGNGGSAGLYQAWNEGAPVLAIPRNFEQHRTMATVAWRGASLSVRSDQVTARRISAAVGRLLDEPAFARNARHIAAEFAGLRVVDTIPPLVDAIVRGI
jgi:UDP:flavonoid glycosyltransferase YjiC (YdhE family)